MDYNKTDHLKLKLPSYNHNADIEVLNDNFIKIDEKTFKVDSQIEDIIDELKLKATEEDVKNLIDNIPDVFHDAPQGSVTEDMNPIDFKHGLTLCSQSNVNGFPTIQEYGVTLTVRGANASYAQIFITRYGDVWARRSGILNSWNGEWYNAKREIDKKADEEHTHRATDITETFAKNFVSMAEKLKINEIDDKADKEETQRELDNKIEWVNNMSGKRITLYGNMIDTEYGSGQSLTDELNKKADKDDLIRSSTIVIANYDNHENSKKAADIVIEKGEDASIKINKAIQSLKDSGGEIKLMEGEYKLENEIKINVDNIKFTGLGYATIINGNSISIFGRNITVSSLQVSHSKQSGIWITDNATVDIYDCKILNCRTNGIEVNNNSSATISNVECIGNEVNGVGLFREASASMSSVKCNGNKTNGIQLSHNSSAIISDVKCIENEANGIGLYGETSAKISNVECIRNKSNGIYTETKSSEVLITSTFFKDNTVDPMYLNLAQLNLGGTSGANSSHIFATGCKIVDTQGRTRGAAIRGTNHALTNAQFVGEFKEKINDDGTDTQLIGNLGV